MAGWSPTRRLPGTRSPATNVRAEHAALVLLADGRAPRRPRGARAGRRCWTIGVPGAGDSRRCPRRLRRYDPPRARRPAGFTRGGVVAVHAVVRPRSDRRTAACRSIAAATGRHSRRRSEAAAESCSRASSSGRRCFPPARGTGTGPRGTSAGQGDAALGMGLGVLPGRRAGRPRHAAFHLPAALHRRADARADRLHRCAGASAAGLSALGYDAAARAVLQAVHVAEVSLRYLEAEAAGVAANPRFLAGAAEALRAATDALG